MSDDKTPPPYTQEERWLVEHHVIAIRTSYKMTSEDTSDDYIELESFNGDKAKWLQSTFNRAAEIRVCGNNLVYLRYGVRERVEKRVKWEQANSAELATYKRLKAKYEGATP